MIMPTPKRKGLSLTVVAIIGAVALCAVGATAATATADTLPVASIGRIVLGTIAAVALLLLTARFLPRLGGAAGVASDSFRVVATLAVGQRERVVVVQVGQQQVMLGVAPGRIDMIQALDEPLQSKARMTDSDPEMGARTWITRVLGRRT